MESLKQEQLDWHYNARVRLSRLAIAMSEAFIYRHDVEQTEEYQALYEQYMQLQTDISWHDYCEGGLQKSRFVVG